jgi:acyl-CoA synthetase (AMP-forming)/AMP-acid ligase II
MAGRIKSAGRATIGCEVQILDSDDCEVPRGTIGEICGRGANVMLGYWKQPELTERTLRNGWLHTGTAATCSNSKTRFFWLLLRDFLVLKNIGGDFVACEGFGHGSVGLQTRALVLRASGPASRIAGSARLKRSASL